MDSDRADPAAGHYNDGNRAFLQALMARGVLTLEEGQKILAAIFTVQEGRSVTSSLRSYFFREIADLFAFSSRKTKSPSRCHASRSRFLHLRRRRSALPLRLRDPEHAASDQQAADLWAREQRQRSPYAARDYADARGVILYPALDGCDV